MSVEKILDAIEQYLKAKNELQTSSIKPCNDWDCGLANEFSGYYGSAEQREKQEGAKAALEKALEDYIDNRIRTVTNSGK